MTGDALWPGNYPAGHYLPLFVILGPLFAAMLVCIYMAVRATADDRKGCRMELGPLGPCDPWTGRAPCPSKHQQAAKVTTVDGVHVGWLCPDCDAVLPPEWLNHQASSRRLAEAHDANHHGAPIIHAHGCPHCAEEITARIN